jgi:hypothetical protein
MSADSDAFKTVQQLGLRPAEEQYLMPVARGEGFFGLGWGSPSAQTIALSAQFGIDPKAGVGSNNWGAIQGTGSAGSFPHVDFGWMIPDESGKPTDKHWKGTGPRVWGPYIGHYKKYATPAEGAADMARVLLKDNVRAALALGDMRAAVFAQHANHYFELAPEKYLSSVKRNYDILTQALGWPVLLKDLVSAGETIATAPLVGSQSSSLPEESSGEPCTSNQTELPEAGFLRGQKYSVPGIQDEPEKK